MTFRLRGHEEASGVKYVPKKAIEKWKKNDPVLNFEKLLLKKKILDKDFKNKINRKIESEVLANIEDALNAEFPESNPDVELSKVFSDNSFQMVKPLSSKSNMRFVDAIKDGLEEKLELDSDVLIMGQDIAEYGGVFKITKGFLEKF